MLNGFSKQVVDFGKYRNRNNIEEGEDEYSNSTNYNERKEIQEFQEEIMKEYDEKIKKLKNDTDEHLKIQNDRVNKKLEEIENYNKANNEKINEKMNDYFFKDAMEKKKQYEEDVSKFNILNERIGNIENFLHNNKPQYNNRSNYNNNNNNNDYYQNYDYLIPEYKRPHHPQISDRFYEYDYYPRQKRRFVYSIEKLDEKLLMSDEHMCLQELQKINDYLNNPVDNVDKNKLIASAFKILWILHNSHNVEPADINLLQDNSHINFIDSETFFKIKQNVNKIPHFYTRNETFTDEMRDFLNYYFGKINYYIPNKPYIPYKKLEPYINHSNDENLYKKNIRAKSDNLYDINKGQFEFTPFNINDDFQDFDMDKKRAIEYIKNNEDNKGSKDNNYDRILLSIQDLKKSVEFLKQENEEIKNANEEIKNVLNDIKNNKKNNDNSLNETNDGEVFNSLSIKINKNKDNKRISDENNDNEDNEDSGYPKNKENKELDTTYKKDDNEKNKQLLAQIEKNEKEKEKLKKKNEELEKKNKELEKDNKEKEEELKKENEKYINLLNNNKTKQTLTVIKKEDKEKPEDNEKLKGKKYIDSGSFFENKKKENDTNNIIPEEIEQEENDDSNTIPENIEQEEDKEFNDNNPIDNDENLLNRGIIDSNRKIGGARILPIKYKYPTYREYITCLLADGYNYNNAKMLKPDNEILKKYYNGDDEIIKNMDKPIKPDNSKENRFYNISILSANKNLPHHMLNKKIGQYKNKKNENNENNNIYLAEIRDGSKQNDVLRKIEKFEDLVNCNSLPILYNFFVLSKDEKIKTALGQKIKKEIPSFDTDVYKEEYNNSDKEKKLFSNYQYVLTAQGSLDEKKKFNDYSKVATRRFSAIKYGKNDIGQVKILTPSDKSERDFKNKIHKTTNIVYSKHY